MSNDTNVIIALKDGGKIELQSMLDASDVTTEENIQRNICRFDSAGQVVWRVGDYNPFPNSTFTNVYLDDAENLIGYNFDGVEYLIDLETGDASPKRLAK